MKRQVTITTLLAILITLTGQGQATFEKTYGNSGDEKGSSIQTTTDGGYLLLGTKFNPGTTNMNLRKVDGNGFEQWSKFYGGSVPTAGRSLQKTTTGDYLLFGSIHYPTPSPWDEDYYLVKTNPSGDIIFAKSYGIDTLDERCLNAIETLDGGYLLAGETNGWQNIQLIKTDNSGTVQWNNTFGNYISASSGGGFPLIQNQDSSFLFLGIIDSSFGGGGMRYLSFIEIDNLGNINSVAVIDSGYAITYELTSMLPLANGNFSLFGYTSEYINAPLTQFLLIEAESTGNELWRQEYGGTWYEVGWNHLMTDDNGYMLVGHTNSIGAGNFDVYIVKTNSSGTELWNKTYGGTNAESAYSIIDAVDSCYIMLGYTESFGNGGEDVYLLKMDCLGNTSGIRENHYNSFLSIYPNPSKGKFTLQGATEEIQVYDLFGRLLLRSNKPEMDMSNYPAGLYVWQVGTARGKLVIE